MIARRSLVLVALVALVAGPACGGDDPASADAGQADAAPDAAPDASVCEPTPPAAPAPPVLTPCPGGWTERAGEQESSPPTCEPWPAGEEPTCASVDEAPFAGADRCARVGSACPASGWPEGIPADRPVLHVRAGADASVADGSRTSPFATVRAAMRRASPGTVIALAAGTHDGGLDIAEGVTVWGACVAETVVVRTVSFGRATVEALAFGAALRNLRIGPGGRAVYVTNAGQPDGAPIRSLRLEDVVIEAPLDTGVVVDAGAELSARNLVVRDMRMQSPDELLAAVFVGPDARADLERVVMLRSAGTGLFVSGLQARASCRSCVILDTLDDGVHRGTAAMAVGGASLELDALAMRGNPSGLYASESTLVASSVWSRDGLELDGSSDAAQASTLGTVTLRRADLAGCVAYAVSCVHGGSLVLEDTLIRDTRVRSEPDPRTGQPVGEGGAALVVSAGGRAEVRRMLAMGNRHVGILASGVDRDGALVRSRLAVEDLVVRDTGPTRSGRFGRAIEAQHAVDLTMRRVRVEGAHELGVALYATVLDAQDLVVRDIAATSCGGACEAIGGIGVGAYDGSSGTIRRLSVERASLAGVQIALGAEIDVVEPSFSHGLVGIALGTAGFDPGRARQCARFDDVDVELDAREVAVPPPLDSLAL